MCTLTILKPLLVAFRRKLCFFEASGKVASRKLLSRKRFNTPSTMVTFNFFRRATPNCTAARFPRSQMRPACYRVCAHRHTRHRDNAQRVLASRTFRGVTVAHQVCCASYSLRTTRRNEAARLRTTRGNERGAPPSCRCCPRRAPPRRSRTQRCRPCRLAHCLVLASHHLHRCFSPPTQCLGAPQLHRTTVTRTHTRTRRCLCCQPLPIRHDAQHLLSSSRCPHRLPHPPPDCAGAFLDYYISR